MKYALPILAAICLSVVPISSIAAIRHVPADYSSIQQAIDASSSGDVVLVAPGVYFELITIDGLDITVESEEGPQDTTIDATYLGTAVSVANSTRSAVIRGFTITRGKGDFEAGGVAVAGGSATIEGNIIAGNLGAGFGNGVSLWSSDALVRNNEIAENANSGEYFGGGGGGGIGVLGAAACENCGAEIRDNLIRGNSVDDFLWGGGIYINAGGPVVVAGNTIMSNSAPTDGAGIAMINGVDARIENNLIADNQVLDPTGTGGGVYWLTPSGSRGPFLIGNTLVNNHAARGSGVYADGYDVAARIGNNVIVGAGVSSVVECGDFNDAHPPIVVNNNVHAPDGAAYAGLCAGMTGTGGNIAADPLFAGPSDYQLLPESPAIDAGLNAFVTETRDILGNPRILDGNNDSSVVVDMGAYEFRPDIIFADGFEP